MYEHLFHFATTRREHSTHFMAPYLEKYSSILLKRGYKREVVLTYLYPWEHFLLWIKQKGIHLETVDETSVIRFIEYESTRRVWRGRKVSPKQVLESNRSGLKSLLQFLRDEGLVLPSSIPTEPQLWYTDPVNHLATFLRSHRGISTAVVERHCREARLYLTSLHVLSWSEALSRMTSSSVDAYLLRRCQTLKRNTHSGVASSLRVFFRYLHLTEQTAEDLAEYVPRIRTYKLSSLPKSIPWSDIEKLLQSVDRNTPAGKRDYAVFLLLTSYGLRRCEATSLRLDDIDWKRSFIQVRHLKSKRQSTFPLLPEVGEALIDYFKHARPKSNHREIFLTLKAPYTPLRVGGAIRGRIIQTMQKADIHLPSVGPHLFRHSFAVHLLQQNVSLKTIGDLLGHCDPASTFTYTKVQTEELREVALDVKEVLS